MNAPLYTREMLGLAVALADYPLLPDSPLRNEQVSRTCGSRVSVGLGIEGGTVRQFGIRAQACAIGQASAALLARHANGTQADELRQTYRSLREWLGGNAPLPDWQGLIALEPARSHLGRHEALLLPWKAADAALSMPDADG